MNTLKFDHQQLEYSIASKITQSLKAYNYQTRSPDHILINIYDNYNKAYTITTELLSNGNWRVGTWYGRIGTKGSFQWLDFSTIGIAEKQVQRLLNEKVAHGYKLISEAPGTWDINPKEETPVESKEGHEKLNHFLNNLIHK